MTVTEDIVIDKEDFPFALIDHIDCVDSVTVGFGEYDSIDQVGIICQVALKYPQILHDFIYIEHGLPPMMMLEGRQFYNVMIL